MEPNRQYRIDAGIKQTVKSRLWHQTNSKEQTMESDSKEQPMESNRQFRVDAGIKQTVKSRL